MDNNNTQDNNKMQKGGQTLLVWAVAALITFMVITYMRDTLMQSSTVEYTYSEFLDLVDDGKIESVVFNGSRIEIEPTEEVLRQNRGVTTYYTLRVSGDYSIYARLEAAGVDFREADQNARQMLWSILSFVVPIVFVLVLMNFMMKRMGGGGIMGVGKSNAKVYVQKETGITFQDVAGEDEAKESLTEIVDFLHNPAKYTQIGAKLPKGALLVGPPGTGKTLLAKAVAGEAHVPFYSLSGSDFVEMFVGVGASRVRDLFKQAQESAPCIIFIDEIDAIGKSRDSRYGGGNDEREQTLNQLLSEMDGFDSSKGLLVLFWGFLGAAAWGILLLILRRELGKRLLGLFSYIVSCIRERRLLIFPGQSKETEPLRLGVFLFLGYLASGLM